MQVERITGPVVEQTEIVVVSVERMARRDGVISIEELQVIHEARTAAQLADEADATVGCALSAFRRDGIRGQRFQKRLRALQQDLARMETEPDPAGPAAQQRAA